MFFFFPRISSWATLFSRLRRFSGEAQAGFREVQRSSGATDIVRLFSEGKRKVVAGLRFADTPQDDDIVGMSGGWSVADYDLSAFSSW